MDKRNCQIVMMHKDERKLIEHALKPEHTMVEWGSGGSTLYFSTKVKKIVSFEHNELWYTKINNFMEDRHNNIDNVEYHHVSSDFEFKKPKGCKQDTVMQYRGTPIKYFKAYVNAIERYEKSMFDIALIDGRCRVYCAVKLLPYLKNDGFLYIHDFFSRKQYHAAYQFYDEVDSSKRGAQTIVKLKKKSKKDLTDPSFYDTIKTTEQITEALGRDPEMNEWISHDGHIFGDAADRIIKK